MLDPFILFEAYRDAQKDPNRRVLAEIEKRRPGRRRDLALAYLSLLLVPPLLWCMHLNGFDLLSFLLFGR